MHSSYEEVIKKLETGKKISLLELFIVMSVLSESKMIRFAVSEETRTILE